MAISHGIVRARRGSRQPPPTTDPASPSGDPRIDAPAQRQPLVAAPRSRYSDPDRGSDYGAGYAADDDRDGIPPRATASRR